MILRLSQKMNMKVKGGNLAELPLDANPFADWSCHLFLAGRSQFIILMNTASFYSCLMSERGITNQKTFLSRAREAICAYMAEDGQKLLFDKFIEPSFSTIRFAKPLNRSAIGSMNDLIHFAKYWIIDGLPEKEIGFRLNKVLLSALKDGNGRKYDYPKTAFLRLAERKIGL
jgi:hypothetical protein